MALEVGEVLALLREDERMLATMPIDAPERKVVAAEVVALKRMFKRLTEARDDSGERLSSSQQTVDAAWSVLEIARRRGWR